MSMAGTPGERFDPADLTPTDDFRPAQCWIFSQGQVGGGRSVEGRIRVRVWRYEN